MGMPAAQADLIDRLRTLLNSESETREVSMFGGRSFMVRSKLAVSALKNGDLLVRVPAQQHDQLTQQSGASQAEMGAGRSMGPGWVQVAAAAIADDSDLTRWLGIALAHNRVTASG